MAKKHVSQDVLIINSDFFIQLLGARNERSLLFDNKNCSIFIKEF